MKRLLSLDFFRGITIAAMIIVNDPGSWSHVYAPLRHAEWNGATPTDLVFPFFLFIVGVSISLSLSKRKNGGLNLYTKIFKRSVIIFLLGIFLALFPKFDFENLKNEDDILIHNEKIDVIIDETSMELIQNSKIDYVHELIGSSFKITNPQATSSCGCGTSFSI